MYCALHTCSTQREQQGSKISNNLKGEVHPKIVWMLLGLTSLVGWYMSHLRAILLTGYIVPRICTEMAAIFCDVTETELKKPESCQALSKARLKKLPLYLVPL